MCKSVEILRHLCVCNEGLHVYIRERVSMCIHVRERERAFPCAKYKGNIHRLLLHCYDNDKSAPLMLRGALMKIVTILYIFSENWVTFRLQSFVKMTINHSSLNLILGVLWFCF